MSESAANQPTKDTLREVGPPSRVFVFALRVGQVLLGAFLFLGEIMSRGRVKCCYPERGFGFIEYDPDQIGVLEKSIFFSASGAESLFPGECVEFGIESDREGRLRATNLELISPDSILTELCYGQVVAVQDDFGFIRHSGRGGRQRLLFHFSDVQPAEDGLIYYPIVGCLAEFQRAKRRDKEAAVIVRIYEWPVTIEQLFESAPELPIEVPVLSPVPSISEPSVLAPATKNIPLIEISRQRRKGKTQ